MAESVGDDPPNFGRFLPLYIIKVRIVVVYSLCYNSYQLRMWRQIISHYIRNNCQALLAIADILLGPQAQMRQCYTENRARNVYT